MTKYSSQDEVRWSPPLAKYRTASNWAPANNAPGPQGRKETQQIRRVLPQLHRQGACMRPCTGGRQRNKESAGDRDQWPAIIVVAVAIVILLTAPFNFHAVRCAPGHESCTESASTHAGLWQAWVEIKGRGGHLKRKIERAPLEGMLCWEVPSYGDAITSLLALGFPLPLSGSVHQAWCCRFSLFVSVWWGWSRLVINKTSTSTSSIRVHTNVCG